MGEEENTGKGWSLLVILFFFGTTLWALWVLMGEKPPVDEPVSAAPGQSVFGGQRDTEEVQARLAEERSGAPAAIPDPDALPPIIKDDGSLLSGTVRMGGGAGSRTRAPAARPPDDPDAAQSLLSRAVKGWNDTLAREAGAKKGMLSSLAARMIKNPKVVRALFDNELVVKAFMSRGRVKENCASADSLKSYLTDRGNSGVLNEKVSLVKSFLGEPESATAFAGSRFAKALTACPSAKALMSDPSSLAPIVASNPGMMSIITDPALMSSLSANPEAASLFRTGTASLGGGAAR